MTVFSVHNLKVSVKSLSEAKDHLCLIFSERSSPIIVKECWDKKDIVIVLKFSFSTVSSTFSSNSLFRRSDISFISESALLCRRKAFNIADSSSSVVSDRAESFVKTSKSLKIVMTFFFNTESSLLSHNCKTSSSVKKDISLLSVDWDYLTCSFCLCLNNKYNCYCWLLSQCIWFHFHFNACIILILKFLHCNVELNWPLESVNPTLIWWQTDLMSESV